MNFFLGLILFNVIILGLNFCFLLIGGIPFRRGAESSPVHWGNRTFNVERFSVGVTTSVLGFSWLLAWFYFLLVGWESFMAQFQSLIVHVTLQLAAALGLVIAGVGIFWQWKHYNRVFLASMGVFMGSTVWAILVFGPQGHGSPLFMTLLTALTFAVGGFLTTATYLLDRVVHEFDENLPQNRFCSFISDSDGHYDLDGVSFQDGQIVVSGQPPLEDRIFGIESFSQKHDL